MKRIGTILSLSLLIVFMSFSLCFASGLELVDSYPQDGSTGYQPVNLMVKLYFNEDVSAKEVQKANKEAFKVTDSKGKEIKTRVLYSKKNLDEIWVLVDQQLKSDADYKLYISGDLKVVNGDTLGDDKVIKFSTRNTSMDTTVNMGLMFVMMIGMVVFSSISMKRSLKKQEEEKNVDSKVNPYKVSKETGKPVEDIVAKTEKEKQKAKAKAEKKNRVHEKKTDDAKEEIIDNGNKKVKSPRAISQAGSTYITGRAAKAKEEAEKRAKSGTTRPKGATGKARNTKAKSK